MIAFADTSYFIALFSRDDESHDEAVRFATTFRGQVVTTEWILNEVSNFFSKAPSRQLFVNLVKRMRSNPRMTIVAAADATFDDGLGLYARRLDKDWSLTDCISFFVMTERKIDAALTQDHHFEQAGFRVLLK